MKKRLLLFFFSMLLLLLMSTSAFAERPNYGALGALKDPKISLAKALTYALEDEYLSQARYDKVIEKYGSIPPFTQINVAEQRHIQELLPFFEKYNIDVPKNIAKEYVNAPNSLKEAFQEGAKGEIATRSMYDKLASIKEFPEDILSVFHELRSESKNHLVAMKRGLPR